jgi:hypothetical protein
MDNIIFIMSVGIITTVLLYTIHKGFDNDNTKKWYLKDCTTGCAICRVELAPPDGEQVQHIYE